jgi:hypothetical protein
MGFALVVKMMIGWLGISELVFRLFPLLCGMFSIFLFAVLAARTLDQRGVTVALILLALSDFHIYYSAELKQYATEFLITLILYVRFGNQKLSEDKSRMFSLLIYGLMAIFFAHTAVLILGPLAFIQFKAAWSQKDGFAFKKLFLACFVWLEALLIVHGRALQVMLGNAVIVKGAGKFFVPYPVLSGRAVTWMGEAFLQIFRDLMGIACPLLGVVLFVIGFLVFFRQNQRQAVLFLAPLLLALLGAILHKYPFAHRFLIFSLPALILLVVRGGLAVVDRISSRPWRIFAGGSLLIFFLLKPVQQAGYFLIHDRITPQNRQAVQYLKTHRKPGDTLILNHSAQFGYGFYLGYDGFENPPSKTRKISDAVFHDGQGLYCLTQDIVYRFHEAGYLSGIQRQGEAHKVYADGAAYPWGHDPRTWILLVHETEQLHRFVLEHLRATGVFLDGRRYSGAAVYLFDMSSTPDQRQMTSSSTEGAAGPEKE